jgi:cell division protein ZapE
LAIDASQFVDILQRKPNPSIGELLAELVPPREFQGARLGNYIPHQEYPSQTKALERAEVFVGNSRSKKLFAKRETPPPGIYLDGGFGVGKTHLLAGAWHEFKGTKAFGSFIAYTSLIGAIGFAGAVEALSKFQLICIDEFELDDPGDTMMMSRLLNELAPKGVRFAATSNTPPNALGEGRFAAADFQREILGISNQFEMVRIDGEDHRHRPVSLEPVVTTDAEFQAWLQKHSPAETGLLEFSQLLKHLSTIHPSRYGFLLESISALGIQGVRQLDDQVDALRLVAFIDRAYEAQIAICATGHPLTDVFAPKYLAGGYRKKYLRAVSRIGALTS